MLPFRKQRTLYLLHILCLTCCVVQNFTGLAAMEKKKMKLSSQDATAFNIFSPLHQNEAEMTFKSTKTEPKSFFKFFFRACNRSVRSVSCFFPDIRLYK